MIASRIDEGGDCAADRQSRFIGRYGGCPDDIATTTLDGCRRPCRCRGHAGRTRARTGVIDRQIITCDLRRTSKSLRGDQLDERCYNRLCCRVQGRQAGVVGASIKIERLRGSERRLRVQIEVTDGDVGVCLDGPAHATARMRDNEPVQVARYNRPRRRRSGHYVVVREPGCVDGPAHATARMRDNEPVQVARYNRPRRRRSGNYVVVREPGCVDSDQVCQIVLNNGLTCMSNLIIDHC